MNVASLENSKRLYELSGWENTRDAHFDPAYDAGYLLRKFSKRIDVSFDLRNDGTTLRYYIGGELPTQPIEADTPENALCLLAIKLFEEGVLNPPNKLKLEEEL